MNKTKKIIKCSVLWCQKLIRTNKKTIKCANHKII